MRALLTFLLISFSLLSQAQKLKGTWEGVYITSDSSFWENIKIVFEWKADSTYSVKSYTAGKNKFGTDTTIVCSVDCKVITPDSLLLSEIEILEPIGTKPGICFQTMELRYYPGGPHTPRNLIGKWYCSPKKAKEDGFIRLQQSRQPGKTIKWPL